MMDDATFSAILDDVAAGEPVRQSLRIHGINPKTFYHFIGTQDEAGKRYARAKAAAIDFMADEIIEIADETQHDTITVTLPGGAEKEIANSEWINRSRLRVDTRKWIMAKLAPKKYGDRTIIAGDADDPLEINHTSASLESKLFPELAAGIAPPSLGKPD